MCIRDSSNTAIVETIKTALSKHGFDDDVLQFISDTDRKYVTEMLNLTDYIDLIIPRGSGRLINFVVKNATVPVIETGTGNCHIFVDESADCLLYTSFLTIPYNKSCKY